MRKQNSFYLFNVSIKRYRDKKAEKKWPKEKPMEEMAEEQKGHFPLPLTFSLCELPSRTCSEMKGGPGGEGPDGVRGGGGGSPLNDRHS